MGTRHKQSVIDAAGNLRVAQYGQWDGYPSGQGKEILTFLHSADLERYQRNLEQIKIVTDEELIKINQDPYWEINYPHFSRNCGSEIHSLIEVGRVKSVVLYNSDDWIQYFYCLDFQQGHFITSYLRSGELIEWSFPLDNLPDLETYLEIVEKDNLQIYREYQLKKLGIYD